MRPAILVTGANGFIGRFTCAALRASGEGWRIVGVSRSVAPVADVDMWQRVDLREAAAVNAMIDEVRPEAVIHLAGALHHAGAVAHVEHNILATAQLTQALAGRCNRYVLGSSGIVYGGPGTATGCSREEDHPRPRDSYAVSKLAAEQIAAALWPGGGRGLVVGRIFNVCGPGQDAHHVVGALARQIASRLPSVVAYGPLTTQRDFIDVRDVARALVGLAMHTSATGCYNIARGDAVTIRDVLGLLVQIAKYTGSIEEVPSMATINLPRQCASVDRLRAIGLAPQISIRQSLEDVIHSINLASNDSAC